MYQNPFFGWSTYDMEGAFFNKEKKELQDELTQLVRIIFLFESELEVAKKKEYERIVQSVTSWLLMNYYHRVALPPFIGVALGEPGSRSFEAAKLSIEELPDTPVIIDEIAGSCYCGISGLLQAINRVIDGELPPPKLRTEKSVQMDAFKNF